MGSEVRSLQKQAEAQFLAVLGEGWERAILFNLKICYTVNHWSVKKD